MNKENTSTVPISQGSDVNKAMRELLVAKGLVLYQGIARVPPSAVAIQNMTHSVQ